MTSASDLLVLGIDPGKRAGVALVTGEERLLFSAAVKDKPAELDRVAKAACDAARAVGQPLLVVIERFISGPKERYFMERTIIGLERRVGAWRHSLLVHGCKEKNIVRMVPSQWRLLALGKGGGRAEVLKDLAREYVHARYDERIVDENEIEAVCIAVAGARRTRHVAAERERQEGRRR